MLKHEMLLAAAVVIFTGLPATDSVAAPVPRPQPGTAADLKVQLSNCLSRSNADYAACFVNSSDPDPVLLYCIRQTLVTDDLWRSLVSQVPLTDTVPSFETEISYAVAQCVASVDAHFTGDLSQVEFSNARFAFCGQLRNLRESACYAEWTQDETRKPEPETFGGLTFLTK